MTMDDERWEPGMPVLDRQAVREPAGTTLRPAQNLPNFDGISTQDLLADGPVNFSVTWTTSCPT